MEHEVLIIFMGPYDDVEIYKVKVDSADKAALQLCHHEFITDTMDEQLAQWLVGFVTDKEPVYSSMTDLLTSGWPIALHEFTGPVVVTGFSA